ncbi:MAG: hypothetical protein HQM16_13440 [Deltaproteobacteria bacterium]|nr:hypothetical protein [Deltaproteobacteria bacterium]
MRFGLIPNSMIVLPPASPPADHTPAMSATGLSMPQRELIADSANNVRAYLERAKLGVVENDISPHGKDKVVLEYRGIPDQFRPVPPLGIWRHYAHDADALATIVAESMLMAGTWHYTHSEHDRYALQYRDVKGVFLTRPHFTGKQTIRAIGVSEGYHVDFMLYEGTGVLLLDSGLIFLVPGEPGFKIPIHIVSHHGLPGTQ